MTDLLYQLPTPHLRRLPRSHLEPDSLAMRLARQVAQAGGRALVVGGFVRDALWGEITGDVDIEVYGLPGPLLESIAGDLAGTRRVGRDFGILKVGHLDVTLPRTDREPGRTGKLQGNPRTTLAEASLRRDFTINALAWDPLNEQLYDPHGGMADIEAGRLRHVAKDTFVQDPLRALRAIQLLARFPLELDPETFALCSLLASSLPDLPKERIFEEMKKLLLRGRRFYDPLEAARRAGLVSALWPELDRLHGCPQDAVWHPEGDVWVHTLMALEAAIPLKYGEHRQDMTLMFSVLCHDLGKPDTTVHCDDGRIRSHRHDTRGAYLSETFMERLTDDKKLISQVTSLVQLHLRPAMLYGQHATDAAVRRLALRADIDMLTRVARADSLGRKTPDSKRGEFPAGDWLLRKAAELEVKNRRPPPIVMGRHLAEMGVAPGPEMGGLLKQLYEMQLDGEFDSLQTGLEAAREKLKQ